MSKDLYNILIIDDRPENLHELIIRMNYDGSFKINTCDSAASAVEFLRNKKTIGEAIDLILLDLDLGDKWGLDVIPEIKEFSNAPILIISVNTDPATQAQALNSTSGCIDFITNDERFSPDLTLNKIKNLLREINKKSTKKEFEFRFEGDRDDREAYLSNTKLELGSEHVNMLKALHESANTPVSRETLLSHCKKSRWRDKNKEYTERSDSSLKIVGEYVNKIQKEIKEVHKTYDPIAAKRAVSIEEGSSYIFTV